MRSSNNWYGKRWQEKGCLRFSSQSHCVCVFISSDSILKSYVLRLSILSKYIILSDRDNSCIVHRKRGYSDNQAHAHTTHCGTSQSRTRCNRYWRTNKNIGCVPAFFQPQLPRSRAWRKRANKMTPRSVLLFRCIVSFYCNVIARVLPPPLSI